MNKHQKDYVFMRIESAVREKESEIEKKHTIPGVSLTDQEKLELVYSNNPPPLNPKNKAETYHIRYVFDFSKHTKKEIKDKKAIQKEIAPIKAEAQKLKDQIMLGDATEALKLMEDWLAKI